MEEDKSALVEKIIKDIHNVLTKITEVYSFYIIPMDVNHHNKSPVLFMENCLGLESWCVKHVYMYCYSELTDNYSVKSNQKQRKILSTDKDRIIKLLNITLLLNPDVSSFWNKRRELVCLSVSDICQELHFTRLILSRKPKCNDAFSYRRWLLGSLLKGDNLPTINIDNIIVEELTICELASDKSPNNYHSWSHRMWFIKLLQDFHKIFDLNSLYIKEYNFSEMWITKHVSDHSCFHYRQFCIRNIFNFTSDSWKLLENSLNISLRKAFIKVLSANFPNDATIQASEEDLVTYTDENLINLLFAYTNKNCKCAIDYVSLCKKLEVLFRELFLSNELINFYKHHETLWYHRRFIMYEIVVIMYDHFGLCRNNGALVKKSCKTCNFADLRQKQAKMVRYDCSRVYSCVLFNMILNHEKRFIDERQSSGDNYADRHSKYLKFVQGFNSV